MDFFASLSRAALFYGTATLTGAIAVFVGVEAWRLMADLFTPDWPVNSPTNQIDVASGLVAIIIGSLYVRSEYRAGSGTRRLDLLMAGCNLVAGAGALYGFFAAAARLIPGISEYPLPAASLTMSGLLTAYLLFHRRPNR